MNSPATRRAGTAFVVATWCPRYVGYAILRRILPLPRVARLAWSPPASARDPVREARTVACVHRLRQFLAPRGDDCLPFSLVLYHALSRTSADPVLHVGFRRGPAGLEGHAWITAGDAVIGDSAANVATYDRAFSFGARGELLPAPASGMR